MANLCFRRFPHTLATVATYVAIAMGGPGAKADLMWGASGHPLSAYPGIPVAEQLDYLHELGLKSYRVNVNDVAALPALADLVQQAKARGIEILPVLTPPVDLANQTADELFAKSYGFATSIVAALQKDVRTWELGNELENFAIILPCEKKDDGTQYNCAWGPAGGTEPLDYYGPRWQKVSAVLKGLSDATRAVDPSLAIAMGTSGWGHTGAFERMKADGIVWDITVWHMYGDDPEPAFKKLAAFDRPIWVTEFNNANGSSNGEPAQAAGLRQMIVRLRELQKPYRVEAAHIYELIDETYWAPSFEAVMGLVRLDKAGKDTWATGGRKAAYETVKSLLNAQ
jgi:Glycosyl hydrolase catalytic core